MLKILGLKAKPSPQPEGQGKAGGHERGPEQRSLVLFLCAAGHSSPGPKGPHGEDGPDAENSPPASPAGNVNPRVQGFLPSLNTQGPCSRGDAREVDVASILACDRRTWEATGGGGLGHSPPLTAATTKAVPKVPGLLFHMVPPCLSSMRLAASPPPSR